jgi:branched-chain amino acid transport system substrate-binding protein
MRPSIRRGALLLLVALPAACTRGTDAQPSIEPTSPAGARLADVNVAFVDDLSREGSAERVAPAFQGARLAIDTAALRGTLRANVHLVPLDTGGTPAGVEHVASQIAADPSFVATIVSPELPGQAALGERLASAGVGTISLSTIGGAPADAAPLWWRAVPDMSREASAVADAVRALEGPRRVCLLGDASPTSTALLRAVAGALGVRPALRLDLTEVDADDPTVIAAIRGAACRSIVWGGSPTGAALLRLALTSGGLRDVRLFGGESLKDASYTTTAGPRGRGTIAVCPCVDLSTSTDLRAQRFIQDYQSEFGVPPGPFAAEGRDVASMILNAIDGRAADRASVGSALATATRFDGLARSYRFDPDGELRGASAAVRVYRDEGVRWVALPAG